MSLHDDYKSLVEMNKEMTSQLNTFKNLNDATIKGVYGLSLAVSDYLKNYTMEQIESFTEDDINKALDCGFTDADNNTNYSNMHNNHLKDDVYKDKSFNEYCIHIFSQIRKSWDDIEDMSTRKDQISKEIEDFSNSYFDYVNSPEYKERKANNIQNLRNKAATTENEYEKGKILRMLDGLEKAENLEFLMERFRTNPDKEVDNIVDIFFTERRSVTVMEKFRKKLPKFGYNHDIYKRFFNLEETFLPERYHIFNNLFLFHVMRTISFMHPEDQNDGLYVSSIFINIYNLIYHKFATTEQEEKFIDFIKTFEDMFIARWADRFDKYNITHPNHPERIKKEAEIDQKHRMMIIAQLQNRGIEPDTNLSTTDLRRMLDEVLEKEQYEEDNKAPIEKEEYNSSDVTPMKPTEVPETTPEEVSEDDDSEEGELIVELDGEDIPLSELVEGDEDKEKIFVSNTNEIKKPKMEEKEVYVDRFEYYYVKNKAGSYTYYTRENTVHEDNIPELTVLQLMSTGSLRKELRTLPTD